MPVRRLPRVNPKKLARWYRALRRGGGKFLFRAEAKRIIAFGASLGIEAEAVEARMKNLWSQENASRREVAQTIMQEMQALHEWAEKQASQRYNVPADRINPDRVKNDFKTFMQGKTIEEAVEAMQQSG